jgi:hypothetical protein BACCOPRO_01444
MPNWCHSHITIIEGDVPELENLYLKLQEWTSRSYRWNSFGTKWLGNVVIGAGLSYEDLECRGEILDMILCEECGRLEIDVYTAWIPMNEMWHQILEKFAPNCHLHIISEEKGAQLYWTEETRGYPSIYPLDFFIEFDEYKESPKDTPKWVDNLMWDRYFNEETFRNEVTPVFGNLPTKELIDKCNDFLYKWFKDVDFVCIHRYERRKRK